MKRIETSDERGIIAWFAKNSVAANLLMMLIILSGLWSIFTIKKALTPEFESNVLEIRMAYPGAAPGEVEQGVILKLEEALKDIDGIKRIQSEAEESIAMVFVEIDDDYDLSEVMDEVKINIDGINEFPNEAEKPIISKSDFLIQAIQLQIYGNINERTGKILAEEVKRELLADDYISKVEIWGTRDYEITIEVTESDLRKYGLTLNRVARAIADASLDIPGGAIRTDNGDIMLRTKGQAYNQQEFEDVVLLSNVDGTRLTLGDIATIS